MYKISTKVVEINRRQSRKSVRSIGSISKIQTGLRRKERRFPKYKKCESERSMTYNKVVIFIYDHYIVTTTDKRNQAIIIIIKEY